MAPKKKDLLIGNPADGNGTTPQIETGNPPYTNEHFLSVDSSDSNAVAPIPGRSASNSSYWQLLADTPGYGSHLGNLSEASENGINRGISVPAGYEVDLGDIYNTSVASPDLQFAWATQTAGGNSFGNIYSGGSIYEDTIDFISTGSPSIAIQYFFFKNSVGTGDLGDAANWSATSVGGTDNAGAPVSASNQYVCIQNDDALSHVVNLDQNATGILDLLIGNSDSAAGGGDTLEQSANFSIKTSSTEIVGETGAGTHVQSAGVNTAGAVFIGDQVGSAGTYSLSGTGSLTAGFLDVALGGSGTFNQSGGSALFTQGINICQNAFLASQGNGTGMYLLSNGSLTVQYGVGVGAGGTFAVSGGEAVLAGVGTSQGGNFVQSGGSISTAGVGIVSNSTMTMSGGTLIATQVSIDPGGTLNLSGGTLNAPTGVAGNLVTTGSLSLINVTGAFTLSSTTSTLAQFVGSTHSFADTNVNGSLKLAGTLSLFEDAPNEALSNSGQTFILFDTTNGGVLSGSFANIATGQMLTTTDGTASYLVTIVPGVDGFVELSDFTPLPAPEPGAVGMIGLAGMAALLRRRRR
jgi:hypothetical protein